MRKPPPLPLNFPRTSVKDGGGRGGGNGCGGGGREFKSCLRRGISDLVSVAAARKDGASDRDSGNERDKENALLVLSISFSPQIVEGAGDMLRGIMRERERERVSYGEAYREEEAERDTQRLVGQ